jgi:hypothetical protein
VIPGSVSVGYLHPGHYAACFAESLTELLFFDAANRARIVSHQHGKLGKECGSGGIVDGRNKVAAVVTNESQAEWLFFVDSDMGFAPDTVERLIAAADPVKRPFVGGLCFAHKSDGKGSFYGIRYRAQPTVYDFVELDDRVGFVSRTNYERDALVAADGTGGACVLVHRSVLAAIQDEHGPNWFTPITHPKGPTTFSEDLSFCARAAALGFPLHIHTGIKTTHDKGGVFLDEEYFDRQQTLLAGAA